VWGSYRHLDGGSGKTRLTGHIVGDQLLARGKRGACQCEVKLTKMVRKQETATAPPNSRSVLPLGVSPKQSGGTQTTSRKPSATADRNVVVDGPLPRTGRRFLPPVLDPEEPGAVSKSAQSGVALG
jgi:hypothetical protein